LPPRNPPDKSINLFIKIAFAHHGNDSLQGSKWQTTSLSTGEVKLERSE
jgi:hypothetical protein